MSIVDAVNAYRLFLGRDPESGRVAEGRGNFPLSVSLADFIASQEFSESILGPLLDNRPLPHMRVNVFPGADILDWAAAALPIGDHTRERVLASRTWRQTLMHILNAPEFFERIGVSLDGTSLSVLRERYGQRAASDREIVGTIEDASAFDIRGWAADLLDLSQPVRLEFLLDNVFIGIADCRLFRRDVQEKLGGAGCCGFSFIVPAVHHRELQAERLLTVRDALSKAPIAVPVRLRAGQVQTLDSLAQIRQQMAGLSSALTRIEATLPDALGKMSFPFAMYHEYQEETQRTLINGRAALSAASAALKIRPSISVVIPDCGAGAKGLTASLKSLQQQVYEHWECLVEDTGGNTATERSTLLDKLVSADPRIRAVKTGAGSSPSEPTMNAAFGAARGAYLLTLEQGDVLAEHALYEMAAVLKDKTVGIVTFDEDTVTIDEFRNYRFGEPKLKPSFDYDFLLASNYIGQKFLFAKDLFEQAGGFGPGFEDAAFLDILLRMLEKTDARRIVHVARVLYHNVEIQDAPKQGDAAQASVVDCLNAHFERMRSGAVATPQDDPFGEARKGCQRIHWPLPDPAPVVSIIVPTRDRADLLGQCLTSVFASQSEYPARFEVIVVDHESRERETHELLGRFRKEHGIKVLPFSGPFNWSAINNAAAAIATGGILVFLNNDAMVLSNGWVREIASQLARPSVGAVGARLLYEDGTVQHAGVLLGVSGGAIHEGIGQETRDGGYLGRTVLQRNVLAVTGACMATRAALFKELEGFDESNLSVEFNDTDYCLKVCDRGLSVIYTPFATLYHFESKSRGFDKTQVQERRNLSERNLMTVRWRKYLEQDPYYNAHFERYSRPFSRLSHPEMLRHADAIFDASRGELVPWFD